MSTEIGSYLADFDKLERTLNGMSGSHYHLLKKNALELFQQQGFPSQQQEAWKYTNTRVFRNQPFKLAQPGTAVELSLQDIHQKYMPGLSCYLITFIDGIYAQDLSDTLPADVQVSSLRSLLHAKQDERNLELFSLLDKRFASLASREQHGFVALNTALSSDGLIIHLCPGQKLEQPIFVLFLSTAYEAQIASYPRILISLDRGAEAQVFEAYHALQDREYVCNSVAEVFIAEQANLEHCRIVCEAPSGMHISRLSVEQKSNSNFQTSVFNFSANLIRNEVQLRVDGEQIVSRLNGLTLASSNARVDNSTVIEHLKPSSESFELYKGIYADRSQGAFSGTIVVHPDAQKTNSMQSSKSLLLADTAQSSTRPQLKIWADDVKCTHGATVGELDQEAMFYLRSRGISESLAKGMLIHAFGSDVIKELKNDSLREFLEQELVGRLAALEPQTEQN